MVNFVEQLKLFSSIVLLSNKLTIFCIFGNTAKVKTFLDFYYFAFLKKNLYKGSKHQQCTNVIFSRPCHSENSLKVWSMPEVAIREKSLFREWPPLLQIMTKIESWKYFTFILRKIPLHSCNWDSNTKYRYFHLNTITLYTSDKVK